MKIGTLTLVTILGAADAMNLRSLFSKHSEPTTDASAAAAPTNDGSEVDLLANKGGRELQTTTNCNEQVQTGNCWHSVCTGPPAPKWHPDYSNGWSNGGCTFRSDCDQTGSTTLLACCKAYFGAQLSGACLNALPSPPTTSPTQSGGLSVYYPDYTIAWTESYCINTYPMPSGHPTYSTMLACCKGAYGGQVSGKS